MKHVTVTTILFACLLVSYASAETIVCSNTNDYAQWTFEGTEVTSTPGEISLGWFEDFTYEAGAVSATDATNTWVLGTGAEAYVSNGILSFEDNATALYTRASFNDTRVIEVKHYGRYPRFHAKMDTNASYDGNSTTGSWVIFDAGGENNPNIPEKFRFLYYREGLDSQRSDMGSEGIPAYVGAASYNTTKVYMGASEVKVYFEGILAKEYTSAPVFTGKSRFGLIGYHPSGDSWYTAISNRKYESVRIIDTNMGSAVSPLIDVGEPVYNVQVDLSVLEGDGYTYTVYARNDTQHDYVRIATNDLMIFSTTGSNLQVKLVLQTGSILSVPRIRKTEIRYNVLQAYALEAKTTVPTTNKFVFDVVFKTPIDLGVTPYVCLYPAGGVSPIPIADLITSNALVSTNRLRITLSLAEYDATRGTPLEYGQYDIGVSNVSAYGGSMKMDTMFRANGALVYGTTLPGDIDKEETAYFTPPVLRKNAYYAKSVLHVNVGAIEERVSVVIFDAYGSRVRTLSENQLLAGRVSFEWAGVDDSGRDVYPGRYFAVVSIGTKKTYRAIRVIR